MTDRNRRVFLQKKLRHRFADDVASADDDRVFSDNFYARTLQDFDNSGGRARDERIASLRQISDIDRVKTVNVLLRIYLF